jgi:hypothetical protein
VLKIVKVFALALVGVLLLMTCVQVMKLIQHQMPSISMESHVGSVIRAAREQLAITCGAMCLTK